MLCSAGYCLNFTVVYILRYHDMVSYESRIQMQRHLQVVDWYLLSYLAYFFTVLIYFTVYLFLILVINQVADF